MPQYLYQTTQDWDYTRLPRLIGRIATIEKGNEKMDGRRFMTVDAGGATYRVYESKGLEEAFGLAQAGLYLDVEFLEVVKLDGGRTFKRYKAAIFKLGKDEEAPKCPEPRFVGPAPTTSGHEG